MGFSLPLAPGAQQRLELGPLAGASAMCINFHRDTAARVRLAARPPPSSWCWSPAISATSADPVEADDSDGQKTIPLDAAHWGSSAGMLGPDALASVCALILHVHAADAEGGISGTISTTAQDAEAPTGLVLLDGGLVDRGPWRELAVQLVGAQAIEDGEVELVDGARGAGRCSSTSPDGWPRAPSRPWARRALGAAAQPTASADERDPLGTRS